MANPVVLAAIRTPIGALHGTFSQRHPVDLLTAVLTAAVDRAGVPAGAVSEVVVGAVEQVGGMAGDVARAAVLAADWPVSVGGTTVDRGATSGVAALGLARALVASAAAPVVVVASVDLPTVVPAGAAAMGRHPFGRPWHGVAANHPMVPPGLAAEQLATARAVARATQDTWAATEVRRAIAASESSALADEIVPFGDLTADELVPARVGDADALAELPPRFDPEGSLTAGNSAPPADGAVAVVVADPGWAAQHGCAPLAELLSVRLAAGAADDPIGAAVVAAREAMADATVQHADLATVEVDEPTAVGALALVDDLALERELVNPNGGPLAFGDLAAGGGLRALTAAAHRLRRAPDAHGLVISAGVGLGAAVVLRGTAGR